MKNVNHLVKTVQAEGMEGYTFSELFYIINTETIEPKAESFSKQLKGDIGAGISEGVDLLIELIRTWDGKGNFHSLYKTSYTNRLLNKIKYLERNKRKHNTSYDVSLSETIDSQFDGGNEMTVIDRLNDSSLTTTFDICEEDNKLEILISKFTEKKPVQGGLIELMLTFSDDMKKGEKTSAYCNYYGVQEYTSVIQRRVSRAKESFLKFLVKNNYEGVLSW